MIYDIPVKKISGEDATLGEFEGKVLLVVNVASRCGLTPQYEGLEKLYEQYKGAGLVVAGFPANDFRSRGPRRRSRRSARRITGSGFRCSAR
jgi:glutathione peroxidase